MNVLLVNPKCPPSFWSFEQSCKLTGTRALNPPLGLITAAALFPEEWSMRLVDLNCRPIVEGDWEWAEMVMVSGMIVQRDGILEIVREAKKRGKTVAAGGIHVTSTPDEILESGCDYVIRGEGEVAVPLFLEALARGEKSGVFEAYDRPDVTKSPIPRFDLLRFEDYLTMAVQSSRGCPFNCEFCDIIHLFGRQPRYKTPEQVMAELTRLYDLGWRGEIFISDDNFIGNRAHAEAILDLLVKWQTERGRPFFFMCQASVNLGRDPKMIERMTTANFAAVFVGIESPDEDVLALNRKYQNIRNPLIECVNTITENGLSVIGSFIIGFDGEKPGAGERIAAFVEATAMPIVMLNTLQVLPNTALWERLKKEGRLLETRTSGNTTGERLNYIPTRPEAEILREYAEAWLALFDPPTFLARVLRYFHIMRPTARALAKASGREHTDPTPKYKPPIKAQVRDIIAFLRIAWWQGIKPSYRRQFWQQLFAVRRDNPSRFVKYVQACSMGENMIRMRPLIRRQAIDAVEMERREARRRQEEPRESAGGAFSQ